MRRLHEVWNDVFFKPAFPIDLTAVRVLLVVQAFWILLSRPDLPELTAWPAEFWMGVSGFTRLRFGLTGSLFLERALFGLLHVALLAAGLGLRSRLSCLVSAILLYHFAPVEEIIVGMPHTFFGGLTVPVLGLFVLSFAEIPVRGHAASAEYRWPVALVQLLFAFTYFVAGIAKLYHGRLGWFTAETIRGFALAHWSMTEPPWALWVADHPAVCWTIVVATALIEFLFPLAVVSPRAAAVLVPAALLFHVGIVNTMRIFSPGLPLVLLFVPWARLVGRARGVDTSEAPRYGRPQC
jgi:hypothetical protein